MSGLHTSLTSGTPSGCGHG